jgi:phage terminase small subunit
MPIAPDSLPKPPAHLSPSAAQWWEIVIRDYILAEHHLRLLQLACEAWDRAQEARAQLEDDGLTVTGPSGVRAHPCIAIEHNARIAVARLVRELDLDTEPPIPDRVGPPALFSNRRGRRARQATNC